MDAKLAATSRKKVKTLCCLVVVLGIAIAGLAVSVRLLAIVSFCILLFCHQEEKRYTVYTLSSNSTIFSHVNSSPVLFSGYACQTSRLNLKFESHIQMLVLNFNFHYFRQPWSSPRGHFSIRSKSTTFRKQLKQGQAWRPRHTALQRTAHTLNSTHV